MNFIDDTAASGESTNSKLLATAAQLFWAKGFAATSTRELAEGLGIQKSSLYHHIKSKEDLLYEISIRSLDHIHQAVLGAIATSSVEVRLQAVIHAHLLTALSERDMHATMLTELRSMSADRRKDVLARRNGYERMLIEVVRVEQAAGRLRPDIDSHLATLALLNLLNWTIFWYREDRGQTIAELADFFHSTFVHGNGVAIAPGRNS